MQQFIKNIIKLFITIIIFYLLSQHVDFKQLFAILVNSNLILISTAILLQIINTSLTAYRWLDISKALMFKEKNSFYFKSYFKGTFFNQVLPSTIGGDAIRIFDLVVKGYSKKKSFYNVFVDRAIGLVSMLIMSLIVSILFYGIFATNFTNFIILVATLGILCFLLLFIINRIEFLAKMVFMSLFYKLSANLNSLYKNKKLLLKHITISIVIHFLSIIVIYILALSVFTISLDFKFFLIAMPVVFLLSIIPISLAGWGIREGVMVGIFILVGLDKTKIMATSILYGILLIISSLPGAYFYLINKQKY